MRLSKVRELSMPLGLSKIPRYALRNWLAAAAQARMLRRESGAGEPGARIGPAAWKTAILGFSVLVYAPTPSAADQVASVIGCSVGSTHLYCSDPTILVLRDALDAAWPEAQRALGTGAIVDQDTAYRDAVLSCGGDRVCLITAVAGQVGTLRGWAYPDPTDAPVLAPSETEAPQAGTPAQSDAAEIAALLGCDGNVELAHCADPSIAALATDRIASAREMIQADPGMAAADKVDRSMLSRALERCADDLSCVRQALTMSTESIRGMAGLPPKMEGPGEVALDEDILALVRRAEDAARTRNTSRIAAAEAEAKAIEERLTAEAASREETLVSQAQTTADAYASEWMAATTALSPYPQSLETFARIYQTPEAWVEWRDSSCRQYPEPLACMAQATFDREGMAALAAEQLEIGQQSSARAAEIARERALEAARLEEQRLEAEARLAAQRQEAAERLARAMVPEEMARIFPPDSLLLHLIDGDFDTLDERLREMVAREYAGPISMSVEMFAPGRAEEIRAGIIANRRNLFAANYAITRYREIGGCGDRVVKTYLRSVSGTETRTLSGRLIDQTEGFDVYIDIPRQFVRYIRRTGVSDSDLFIHEVRAMGCGHPARRIVEDNLEAFAERRDFIPWQQ